jgi:predicted dehydrogenase
MAGWWPPGHIIGYEHSFIHTVYDFIRAIADRKPPRPSFADGVQNQRILDAISRSAASGGWERIPEAANA